MLNEMSLLPLDQCNQMGSNKAHKEKFLINRALIAPNTSDSLGNCRSVRTLLPVVSVKHETQDPSPSE